MLRIEHVSKRFGPAGAARVLDNVDLTIEPGEFVCVVGPSGCGKTTLLNIIAGFEPVTSGVALLNDAPIRGGGPDRVMLFQDAGAALFPWQTAKQNVEFGVRLRGTPSVPCGAVADLYLQMVGLYDHREKYPSQLSGGMRQRLQLARAFAVEPQILLMDEPFGALDALTRRRMHSELLTIWQRTAITIVFVTHDVAEAVTLADRIAIFTRGPGSRVIATVPVGLDRPRSPSDPEFGRLFAKLEAILEEAELRSVQ